MKTVRLTRSDKNRLQRPNREVSSFIEQLVVAEYSDFDSGFTDSNDYDIQGSGSVAEVKHALKIAWGRLTGCFHPSSCPY